MDLIVDSCVVISGVVLEDVLHDRARQFFLAATERGDVTWAPATVLWDISMRFVHPTKLNEIGGTVDHDLKLNIHTIPVTEELFYDNQTTHLRLDRNALRVVRSSIRGPDHIFLSCALAKRAPLVTWDAKVHAQAADFGVAVITPDDYVAGKTIGVTAPVLSDGEVMAELQRRFERVGSSSTQQR